MKNLSKEIIEKLSHPKSFVRGEKYYSQGRVINYSENDNFISAEVIGTDNYHVSISKTNWDHNCDCLAYNDENFCKHEIAVLLTKLYGIISAEKKTTIKMQPPKNRACSFEDLKSILDKKSKDSLINEILYLSKVYPEIQNILSEKYRDKDDLYYKEIENYLNKSVCRLKRIKYGRGYGEKIFTLCQEVEFAIEKYPVTKQTTKILLSASYKFNETLDHVDDSYGNVQQLIMTILSRSVMYLNSGTSGDLDLFYEFSARDSLFDFNYDLIESILNNAENQEVIHSLISKLEKSMYRKDPDINIKSEFLVGMLADYYKNNNIEKYEELVKEYSEQNLLLKLDYLKFLHQNKRYAEVIEAGAEMYDRYDVKPKVDDALIKLGRIPELIDLMKTRQVSDAEINTLKEMKSVNGFWDSVEREELVDTMLKNCIHPTYKIKLLNVAGRYSELKDALINNPQRFDKQEILEKYALQFMMYNPELSFELYKELLEMELSKMRTSNYYVKLFEYLKTIKDFGEEKFSVEFAQKLIQTYPSKKKLLEGLSLFCEQIT